jgi:hypothetical protein
MNILTEIVEKSDEIVDVLNQTNFFDDYPFIDEKVFKYRLQVAMQRKWEQSDDMNLSSNEFIKLVKTVSSDGIAETINEMCEKDLLRMAVNPKGELVYTLSDGIAKGLNHKEMELISLFTNIGGNTNQKNRRTKK